MNSKKEKGDTMSEITHSDSSDDFSEFNYVRPTDQEILEQTVKEKLELIYSMPGLRVAFDPDEAELAGAFRDEAVGLEDVLLADELED